ncbi:transposase-like protein [Deinococcus sp. UYEF24]
MIQYALWLYHRSSLSQHDVQEAFQERGIQVTHEALRERTIKFAPLPTEQDTRTTVPPPIPKIEPEPCRLGMAERG